MKGGVSLLASDGFFFLERDYKLILWSCIKVRHSRAFIYWRVWTEKQLVFYLIECCIQRTPDSTEHYFEMQMQAFISFRVFWFYLITAILNVSRHFRSNRLEPVLKPVKYDDFDLSKVVNQSNSWNDKFVGVFLGVVLSNLATLLMTLSCLQKTSNWTLNFAEYGTHSNLDGNIHCLQSRTTNLINIYI